jgi:hypothetical protein
LIDFFATQTRNFTQISVPTGYGVSYFQNYFNQNGGYPSGPDAGEGDGSQE